MKENEDGALAEPPKQKSTQATNVSGTVANFLNTQLGMYVCTPVRPIQGDQMSLWKKSPKMYLAQIHLCQN
jgi:hypothetical protein